VRRGISYVAEADQRRARRTGSICTGAYLLAAAGILNNRPGRESLGLVRRLATMFPRVRVEQDPIFIKDGNVLFIKDGNVYTSAGVTAGIDLALAMVEEDHGHPASFGDRA